MTDKRNEEDELRYVTSRIVDAELTQYELSKATAIALYKTFTPVLCPAFKEDTKI